VRRFIDPRHQGERARHAVYDLVVLLSVMVALQHDSTSPSRIVVYLGLTLLGVAFAEVYAGFVARRLTERRTLTRAEHVELLDEVLGGIVLASLPLVWVVLGAVGAIGRERALALASWTGLVLLGLYGTLGARAAGLSMARSVSWGIAVTTVGAVLVTAKSFLH
jgi:hypothetical protein